LAARAADHERPWADLRADFVAGSGLSASSDHPFVDELTKQVDGMSDDDRAQLLDDKDALERFAYELAQQHADAPAQAQVPDMDMDIHTLLSGQRPYADMPPEQQGQLLAQVRTALGG
jgi:hypothetical protein